MDFFGASKSTPIKSQAPFDFISGTAEIAYKLSWLINGDGSRRSSSSGCTVQAALCCNVLYCSIVVIVQYCGYTVLAALYWLHCTGCTVVICSRVAIV